MLPRYVITFAPPKSLGVLGVIGEVVEIGAAMVRIVPKSYTLDRLPSADLDLLDGFLVKRTMIFAETQNPEIYNALLAHEERMLNRMRKMLTLIENIKRKNMIDAELLKQLAARRIIFGQKTADAEARSREIAKKHMLIKMSIKQFVTDKFLKEIRALGRGYGKSVSGFLVEESNEYFSISGGKYWVTKYGGGLNFERLQSGLTWRVAKIDKKEMTTPYQSQSYKGAYWGSIFVPGTDDNPETRETVRMLLKNREKYEDCYRDALAEEYGQWISEISKIDEQVKNNNHNIAARAKRPREIRRWIAKHKKIRNDDLKRIVGC